MSKACCGHTTSLDNPSHRRETVGACCASETEQVHRTTPAAGLVPLSQLGRGTRGVVRESRLAADEAALLRAMGVCLNVRVRVCRSGEPCIIALDGVEPTATPRSASSDESDCACGRGSDCGQPSAAACRIGLSRPVAERILVAVVA